MNKVFFIISLFFTITANAQDPPRLSTGGTFLRPIILSPMQAVDTLPMVFLASDTTYQGSYYPVYPGESFPTHGIVLTLYGYIVRQHKVDPYTNTGYMVPTDTLCEDKKRLPKRFIIWTGQRRSVSCCIY